MAECLEKAGKPDQALAAYEAVIAAAPRSSRAADARMRIAALHEQAGALDKALALYEEVANTSSGEEAAEAGFRVGEMLAAQGDHDRAARSFMRVAILFLHERLSPEALWRAGQSFEAAGKPDQARKAYAEIAADYPDSPRTAEAQAAIARLGAS
jgi:TolA-binding protein